VHFPPEHALNAAGEEPAVVAYKLGRIEDGVHNAPVGHEPVALDEFVNGLVAQAQAEYPDATIAVERLVDNGDGTSRWIPADQFDPEQHTPVGPGNQVARDVTTDLSAGAQG
jgi:hypothetical protein